MLELNGNRTIQKREVEKRMLHHWGNIKDAKSKIATSWDSSNSPILPMPRDEKAKNNNHIVKENLKLITTLYDIHGDSRKSYSPNRLCTQIDYTNPSNHIELINKRKKHNKKIIKQKQLEIQLKNNKHNNIINKISPVLSTSKLVKEYEDRKRVVDLLRHKNSTSRTALHLLKDTTNKDTPISMRLSPSYATAHTFDTRPKSASATRHTNNNNKNTYQTPSPYNAPAFTFPSNSKSQRPKSAGHLQSALKHSHTYMEDDYEITKLALDTKRVSGKFGDTWTFQKYIHDDMNKQSNYNIVTEEHKVYEDNVNYLMHTESAPVLSDITATGSSRQRKVLVHESEVRANIVVNGKQSNVSASNENKTESISRPHHPALEDYIGKEPNLQNQTNQTQSVKFKVRLYDVGLVCPEDILVSKQPILNSQNIESPQIDSLLLNGAMSHADNNNNKDTAISHDRLYSTPKTNKNTQIKLISTSSGILVDARLLPETEKTLSHEIFIPIKQLCAMVNACEDANYDSLYRQLRRLRLLDSEKSLYTSLSTGLNYDAQEKLVGIIMKNIELFVDVPPTITSNKSQKNAGDRDNQSPLLSKGAFLHSLRPLVESTPDMNKTATTDPTGLTNTNSNFATIRIKRNIQS